MTGGEGGGRTELVGKCHALSDGDANNKFGAGCAQAMHWRDLTTNKTETIERMTGRQRDPP